MKKKISVLISIIVSLFLIPIVNLNNMSTQAEESIEIVSLRSEYGKHFDNGDGTKTAYISTVPIHYMQDGEWKEIDNSLMLDDSGNYVNISNKMKVNLANNVNLTKESSTDMVTVEYEGYSLKINPFCKSKDIISSEISLNDRENFSNSKSEFQEVCDIKLRSAVTYNSLYDNLDLNVVINSSSVSEEVVLDKQSSVPEIIQYFVEADGLQGRYSEDGTAEFIDDNGDIVFMIPSAYMYDSSDEPQIVEVETSYEEYENGCLMTIIPDMEWLLSNDIVYPVQLSSGGANIYDDVTDYYISQSEGKKVNTSLHIGGSISDKHETYIAFDGGLNLPNNSIIADAKLYVYFSKNDEIGNNSAIYAKAMTVTQPSSWETTDSSYQTSSRVIDQNFYGYTYFPIDKNIVYSWLNHEETSVTGLEQNGVKLMTDRNSDSRYFYMWSSRIAICTPFFRIAYSTDSDYTLTYQPEKYNKLETTTNNVITDNFQNRMNCYAYALQVYYRGTGDYKLMPGEIGISYAPPNDPYNIVNRASMDNVYSNFQNEVKNIVRDICCVYPPATTSPIYYANIIKSDTGFLNKMSDYSNFVEEQMYRDSQAMSFDINKIDYSANMANLINQDNERIIAMVTYYRADDAYSGVLDCHFYLRNGNGSCPTHGGNCSEWSQKFGFSKIQNIDGSNNIICDQNIDTNAHTFKPLPGVAYLYAPNDTRYYKITKKTDVYKAYHDDGNYGSCTGTPYYSY